MNDARPEGHEWLKVLLQHHQDSFTHTRSYLRMRERAFFFSLSALTAVVLESAAPGGGGGLLATALARFLGPDAVVPADFLSGLLWFLLFALVLRYYQINLVVQRQYAFLHLLEEEMTRIYGKEYVFEREGRSYLTRHPIFSACVDTLYTWLFPFLLVFMVVYRSAEEWQRYRGGPFLSEAFATLMAACIVLLNVIYLYSLKFRPHENSSLPSIFNTEKQHNVASLTTPEQLQPKS